MPNVFRKFRTLLIAACSASTFFMANAQAGALEEAILAAKNGRTEEVAALLQRGLDPNTADREGTSLLGLAVREGDEKTVDLLLQYRASPNRRNTFGDSPLLFAVLRGKLPLVKKLHAAGGDLEPNGWTALHYAVYGGHLSIAEFCVQQGVDVNRRAPNQRTALMLAAQIGNEELVKFLLDKKADTSLVDAANFTASQIAKAKKFPDIAQRIDEYKAGAAAGK